MDLPVSLSTQSEKRRFGVKYTHTSNLKPEELLRELGQTFRAQSFIKSPTFASIVDLINRTSFSSIKQIQQIEKYISRQSEKIKKYDLYLFSLANSTAKYLKLLYSETESSPLIDCEISFLQKMRNDYLIERAKIILTILDKFAEQQESVRSDTNSIKHENHQTSVHKSKKPWYSKFLPVDRKTVVSTDKSTKSTLPAMPHEYCVETMTQFCVSCVEDPACSEMILNYFEFVDPTKSGSPFAFTTHFKILIATIESIALSHPYRLAGTNSEADCYEQFVDTLCQKAVNWFKSCDITKYPSVVHAQTSLISALETIDNKRKFAYELNMALAASDNPISY